MAGYLQHFGLSMAPFKATPDPRFAYATREHQLAVAKIQYCVEERQGIFLLQGEIGAGKTTVSQLMLNEWRQDPETIVAHITNPKARTPAQFLRLLLAHYGLETPFRTGDCWATLRAFLVGNHKEGKNTVVVLDEAQTISPENMETLTHLSNEQTQTSKLIQIVMLAQPNIIRKLSHHVPLRERIAHGSTLNPLTYQDAVKLLRHRVTVAGGDFDRIFPDEPLLRQIYNHTKGIPRRLCILADNVLLCAYASGKQHPDEADLHAALEDLTFKKWEVEKQ